MLKKEIITPNFNDFTYVIKPPKNLSEKLIYKIKKPIKIILSKYKSIKEGSSSNSIGTCFSGPITQKNIVKMSPSTDPYFIPKFLSLI